jgi:type IV secretory pathway ATPase VirB11/archaellum biosynthesis ATPase
MKRKPQKSEVQTFASNRLTANSQTQRISMDIFKKAKESGENILNAGKAGAGKEIIIESKIIEPSSRIFSIEDYQEFKISDAEFNRILVGQK